MFIPQKIADRLKDYIREKEIRFEERIFPITCNATRAMVKKAGLLAGVPKDLTESWSSLGMAGKTSSLIKLGQRGSKQIKRPGQKI